MSDAPAPDTGALLPRLAARDPLAAHLGIEYVEGGTGTATVRLAVERRHLNFNGTCHGGVIFSLADTAFGLASNSHAVTAAAIDAHVTFNAAVREGEVLTATASETSRGRRLATYGVDVARADARQVARFTGTVFILGDPHPGDDDPGPGP